MKKYVTLGYIFGIGGWQTYTANKLLLMKEHGWKIYAISNHIEPMQGDMLPLLIPYKNNRILEFSLMYPSDLSKKDIKRVCKTISIIIDYKESDNVIFEATHLHAFLWAELLAKYFNGRSICVEVSNRFQTYPNDTLKFFHFKEQRNELLMMSSTGKHELFEGYIKYPEIDNNTVGALTQDNYEHDGKDYKTILDISKYDYIIGTVGWLDKGYYGVLIDEVIKFCNQNQDKKIQFIVIGKSLNGDIETEYEKKARKISNLKLSLMGSISPVPSNLVQLFDVSVASYGCAIITDKLGVPTISMHDPDDIPLGILSYTITMPPYNTRVNEGKTISDMITDVLINKVCDHIEKQPYSFTDVEKQKEVHLQSINNLPEKIEYYDIMSLTNEKATFKHKVRVIFQKLFGFKISRKVTNKLKKADIYGAN